MGEERDNSRSFELFLQKQDKIARATIESDQRENKRRRIASNKRRRLEDIEIERKSIFVLPSNVPRPGPTNRFKKKFIIRIDKQVSGSTDVVCLTATYPCVVKAFRVHISVYNTSAVSTARWTYMLHKLKANTSTAIVNITTEGDSVYHPEQSVVLLETGFLSPAMENGFFIHTDPVSNTSRKLANADKLVLTFATSVNSRFYGSVQFLCIS